MPKSVASKVAITREELTRLTSPEMAKQVIGAGSTPEMILAVVFDCLTVEERVKVFKCLGLLKEDTEPPKRETEPHDV